MRHMSSMVMNNRSFSFEMGTRLLGIRAAIKDRLTKKRQPLNTFHNPTSGKPPVTKK
jgi:hypothetical protein